jgi:ribose 5-phosphate isomerase A
MTDLRALKIEAAREALTAIRDGMVVGLGTGSTAEEFVRLLAQSLKSGQLRGISGICTSRRTEELARRLEIPITTMEELERVDVAVDGADEIDPDLRLIKGRGGALLREKVVEQAAGKFIVIADHTKEVTRLGVGPLPVAIACFAEHLLQKRFTSLSLEPKLRSDDGKPFVTDDGHYIFDVRVPATADIAEIVAGIEIFAGVVETGFFPDEASEVIIAAPNGIRRRRRGYY